MNVRKLNDLLESARQQLVAEGEGDEAKAIQAMVSWIEDLEKRGKAAVAELKSKKTPGHACQEFVGRAVRTSQEDWYDTFYR